jgi:signal transduction histidine kinase/CheY-like chemotaxis protein
MGTANGDKEQLELLRAEVARLSGLLARSEARLRETQRLDRTGSWTWDPATDTAEWTPELYELLKRDPALPPLSFMELEALFTPESRARIHEAASRTLTSGEPYREEVEQRRCDGETIWVLACGQAELDASGRVLRMHGTAQDITGRKRAEREKAALEARLQHTQKLELIGRLAGGVAHDFNNLLSTVCGHAEFLQASLPAGDPRLEDLDGILDAAKSGTALTRQLLAFSRQKGSAPAPMDLNAALEEMRRMLSRLIGENYELVFKLAPSLGLVKADPRRVEQVLMNLALNARDAMPGGGTILVGTEDVSLDAELPSRPAAVPPGRYARLTVADSGCGMEEAVLSRLFEPFFTTKETGKGTGLGLSIVRDIVEEYGGRVTVDSAPGKGTTFGVYLPYAGAEAAEAAAEAAPAAADGPGGTERLLLAEDDAGLRRITARNLRAAGYRVYEARNGREALTLYTSLGNAISLVVSDMAMPVLDGAGLLAGVRAVSPGAKFIFMTAYDNSPERAGGELVLPKPVSRKVLLEKIREALDS